MSKEKVVLSIVAIFLGLLVAGGAFYIYQMTKTINTPNSIQTTTSENKPTPATENGNFLIVQNPKDEELFERRIINITGKTTPDAIVIISSQSIDQVVKPSTNGDFTLTHTLEDGTNILKITAIFTNGKEQTITRTVTSTTEEF